MKPILKQKISSIMLYVNDLERTSKWYCEQLGFSLGQHDFNDFVELQIDGQYVMHLFKSDKGVLAKSAFALETSDIDFAYDRLSKNNVEVLPMHHYGDNKSFRFKDCEGNVLILTQWLNKDMENRTEIKHHPGDSYPMNDEISKVIVTKDITVIAVYVNDLESASKWYCENLGFTIGNYDYNDYVELFLDGQYMLNLSKTVDGTIYLKAYFSFDTINVELAHQTLTENGVVVYPIESYSDHKSFHFKDCDGNMLLITQWL